MNWLHKKRQSRQRDLHWLVHRDTPKLDRAGQGAGGRLWHVSHDRLTALLDFELLHNCVEQAVGKLWSRISSIPMGGPFVRLQPFVWFVLWCRGWDSLLCSVSIQWWIVGLSVGLIVPCVGLLYILTRVRRGGDVADTLEYVAPVSDDSEAESLPRYLLLPSPAL